MIIRVQYVVKFTGILFAGMKLFRTAAPGIVTYVVSAKIGENGIALHAINVHMVYRFLVKDVENQANRQ
jgi:hypothetical protein